MPRIRRTEIHASIREDIKATARRLMLQSGAGGLSLRAIAREMDITAPAIYTYFPTLDDLITALIVDAFNGLADAMQTARDAQPATQRDRLIAAMQAYHTWAQAHPTEYKLIYGTPIPDYEAPGDITVPAAVRIFAVLTEPVEIALQSGEAQPKAPHDSVPVAQQGILKAMIEQAQYPVSPLAVYQGFRCFSALYGLVMSSLTGHLTPLDTDVYFRDEVDALMLTIGFSP